MTQKELSKKMLEQLFSPEDVETKLDMLENVAAGIGKNNLSLLTLVLCETMYMGYLSESNMRRLVSMGFNILSFLSKKNGIPIGCLRENLKHMLLTASDLVSALEFATSPEGVFYNLHNLTK